MRKKVCPPWKAFFDKVLHAPMFCFTCYFYKEETLTLLMIFLFRVAHSNLELLLFFPPYVKVASYVLQQRYLVQFRVCRVVYAVDRYILTIIVLRAKFFSSEDFPKLRRIYFYDLRFNKIIYDIIILKCDVINQN